MMGTTIVKSEIDVNAVNEIVPERAVVVEETTEQEQKQSCCWVAASQMNEELHAGMDVHRTNGDESTNSLIMEGKYDRNDAQIFSNTEENKEDVDMVTDGAEMKPLCCREVGQDRSRKRSPGSAALKREHEKAEDELLADEGVHEYVDRDHHHDHHHHHHRHHHHHNDHYQQHSNSPLKRRCSRSESPKPRSHDLRLQNYDEDENPTHPNLILRGINESKSSETELNGERIESLSPDWNLPCVKTDRKLNDDNISKDVMEAPCSHGIANTPTRKVVHESTLLSFRPSVSPRSHPLVSPEDDLRQGTLSPSPEADYAYKRLKLGPILFGSAEAKGLRPYMEDRHVKLNDLVFREKETTNVDLNDGVQRNFAAVYDGHNGTLAADHAQERLHAILGTEPAITSCTGHGPPTSLAQEEERIQKALVRAFEVTDEEILERCCQEGGRSGATGVVVVRIGNSLYAAHCGDSRAVLCRSGEPLRLTEDHKPNLPRERKRVEALGGRVDFARCWRVIVDPGDGRPASGLAVSRSFGDPDFKKPLHLITATPDVMREQLDPEDSFFILASDGLWDVMSDKEACDIVWEQILAASGQTNGHTNGDNSGELNDGNERGYYLPDEISPGLATQAAEALVQASLNAGTMDNVTAIVGLLQWKG